MKFRGRAGARISSGERDGRAAHASAELSGPHAFVATEGPAERELRVVPHRVCDGGEAVLGGLEQLGRSLHTHEGERAERRHTDRLHEAAREHRARGAQATREARHRPTLAGALPKERERPTNQEIAPRALHLIHFELTGWWRPVVERFGYAMKASSFVAFVFELPPLENERFGGFCERLGHGRPSPRRGTTRTMNEPTNRASSTSPGPAPASSEPLVREHLFAARTVLLFGEITSERAHQVSAELLALAAVSAEPILLVLHSQGGHVESADTIFDVIRFIEPQVRILGTGWVASAGALIYASAPLERRFALPNTRFLLHQPLGGVSGPATDIEIEARQINKMRARLEETFAVATGRPRSELERDMDRNHWLDAEEARSYGLVGRIINEVREIS